MNFREALDHKSPMVLDGGMSNVLMSLGANLDTELWCAELLDSSPDLILQAHLKYLQAGVDILTSCTYQASVEGFEKLGFRSEQIEELFKDSIRLMQQARDLYFETHAKRPVYLAASLGPYGAYLADGSEYTGNYQVPDATLRKFHAARLECLIGSGHDIVAFETIPRLQEAEIIAELMSNYRMDGWVSFSCSSGQTLRDGTLLSDAAGVFKNIPHVFAVGVNCVPPEIISEAIEVINATVPLKHTVVYPNAGQQYDAQTKTWSSEHQSSNFQYLARQWSRQGANIIGGCCEIGSQEIRGIVASSLDLI